MNSRRRSHITKDTHLSDIHEDVLLPLPDRAALFGGQIEVRLAVVVALRTPPPSVIVGIIIAVLLLLLHRLLLRRLGLLRLGRLEVFFGIVGVGGGLRHRDEIGEQQRQ